MRKLLIIFTLIPFYIQAQDCDCRSSFDWLKTTFENNDAGYPMVIEGKGIDVYNKFSDSVANVADKMTNDQDCVELLNEWVHFFRKGHVGVYFSRNASKNNSENKDESNSYKEETYVIDTTVFFEQLKQRKSYEIVGVWNLGSSYSMAIVPDTVNEQRDYVGVLLSTNKSGWKPGQVKVELFSTDSGNYANYHMADHSVIKGDFNYTTLTLKTCRFYWTRSADYLPSNDREQISNYLANEPLLKQINNETVLLRVPSFNYQYRNKINKLISDHRQLLDSSKILIVDLMGNGGGSDNSFSYILPYLYTNPIKIDALEVRSTPLTYKSYKALSKRSFLNRLYFWFYLKKRLKKNMGSYFNRFSDSVIIRDQYEPKAYPQKVFVIVDDECASSTEQFVLYAEQSTKTTIVGEKTFGAIDVSNVVTVKFPNNKYGLSYATSRSYRTQHRKIDDIGIEPDVTIPDSIPKYKWLKYIEDNMLK